MYQNNYGIPLFISSKSVFCSYKKQYEFFFYEHMQDHNQSYCTQISVYSILLGIEGGEIFIKNIST